ncbi:hypothetical protein [Cystobacter ferrugineus]|uniref:Lipoprotein n=1 Tax=Cystobacter ferrugineus TaxID=83449 RepID=A0A1L9BCS8_9BACT|nr:hypothetical protein [Cystobacter ferrugineus]OJH40054.1 hypothetical protein BON30_13375 [Cystobacter ferrugineus]
MHRLGQTLLAVSLFAGCGGTELEPSTGPIVQQRAPLTTTDVDVAPECQGLIDFVNTASFQTLDVYLPSDVANNLVTRRALSPFTSLADVASVRLVGPTRLAQIEGGAREEEFIGPNCVGILDGLAVSTDDAAAIVSLVNSISDSELHDVLPYAWNGAVNLLNQRPFTSARDISNVAGISEVSLRNIRNAATLSRPLEALIDTVNALPNKDLYGASMARHFDWWQIVTTRGSYGVNRLECFGLEPSSVPYGATVREGLADAEEVRDEVIDTLNLANRNKEIPQSVIDAGLANLDALTEGRSFKGCYFSYSDDPWSGNNVAIFVDTENGFSLLTETYWSE